MITTIIDNALPEADRQTLYEFLTAPGWHFGWKSNTKTSHFSFWHKHFAGAKSALDDDQRACEGSLSDLPLLGMWRTMHERVAVEHTLMRCYANGFIYGCDGDLHSDATKRNFVTFVYYPHAEWSPNWGGETVLFKQDKSDIIGAIYPKGNRLAAFQGNVPHVARGVSRSCPVMRITLMFKTYRPDYLLFLQDNTMAIQHSGRSLFTHLTGTCRLLRKWGCPDVVCLAGLFHSIYGTETFMHQTVPPDRRDVVQGLIGAEAEELVMRFSGIGRDDPDCPSLNEIEAANLIEQGCQTRQLERLLYRPVRTAVKQALEERINAAGSSDLWRPNVRS